jgi:hypothetical protein
MLNASAHIGLWRVSLVWRSWWTSLVLLSGATVCLNLALLPKATVLIEEVFTRSLWLPIDEGQLNGVMDVAKRGLVFHSVLSGFRVAVFVPAVAALAKAVFALQGREPRLSTCATAAVIFATVLFLREALGGLCIFLTPVQSATMESLRFRTGISLFVDTAAWGPAADYILDKADPFGVGAVLLSAAWLRRRMDLTWPGAVSAMILPALAALSVGLLFHLALSAKLGQVPGGTW